MAPKDLSLLLSVQRAIAELIPVVAEEEHRAMLRTIAFPLNELLLRQDNTFEREFYAQGARLVRAGVELGLGDAGVLSDLPDAFAEDISSAALAEHSARVTAILEEFVIASGSRGPVGLNDWLNQVTDWEVSLYRRRMQDYEIGQTVKPKSRLTRDALQAYLREKFPAHPQLEVTAFIRLFGGFSKLTIMFSTSVALFDCTEFVIRAEQASIIEHPGGKSNNEFEVMRFAFEQGVRIPEPLWVELDADKLGARFVVSRRAKGGVFGFSGGASSQLEPAVLLDLARELVKIHSVKVDPDNPRIAGSHMATWAALPTLRDTALYKLEYWRGILATSPHTPSPMIERSFNWLAANIPDCDEELSMVHGDYGLHNLLIHEGKVNAVLDWEVTHFGDRAQDVIYFIMCMVGTATHDEVLNYYYEAGGKPVSADRLAFYDVYMSFNIMMVCNIALARLDVIRENPALADIGLRMMHVFAERVRAIVR